MEVLTDVICGPRVEETSKISLTDVQLYYVIAGTLFVHVVFAFAWHYYKRRNIVGPAVHPETNIKKVPLRPTPAPRKKHHSINASAVQTDPIDQYCLICKSKILWAFTASTSAKTSEGVHEEHVSPAEKEKPEQKEATTDVCRKPRTVPSVLSDLPKTPSLLIVVCPTTSTETNVKKPWTHGKKEEVPPPHLPYSDDIYSALRRRARREGDSGIGSDHSTRDTTPTPDANGIGRLSPAISSTSIHGEGSTQLRSIRGDPSDQETRTPGRTTTTGRGRSRGRGIPFSQRHSVGRHHQPTVRGFGEGDYWKGQSGDPEHKEQSNFLSTVKGGPEIREGVAASFRQIYTDDDLEYIKDFENRPWPELKAELEGEIPSFAKDSRVLQERYTFTPTPLGWECTLKEANESPSSMRKHDNWLEGERKREAKRVAGEAKRVEKEIRATHQNWEGARPKQHHYKHFNSYQNRRKRQNKENKSTSAPQSEEVLPPSDTWD